MKWDQIEGKWKRFTGSARALKEYEREGHAGARLGKECGSMNRPKNGNSRAGKIPQCQSLDAFKRRAQWLHLRGDDEPANVGASSHCGLILYLGTRRDAQRHGSGRGIVA